MPLLGIKTITFFILSITSVALINCSADSPKADFSASDREEIMEVLNGQAVDWSNGDMEKFMEGYWKSDSLQFIKRGEIAFGWQQTLDNYKMTYSHSSGTGMGKLQFDILKLNPVSGDAAFLTGKFFLERGERKSNGLFTLVFRKIDGRWVIVYDHTS